MKKELESTIKEWLRFVEMDQDKDTDAIRTTI